MSAPSSRQTPNRQQKSRIVVDLNPAQPQYQNYQATTSGKQRRKGGRVWKVLAVMMLLIIVGFTALLGAGFFWWRSYQRGPAYSLALMVDAAQRDDTLVFDEIVDTDAIASSLVPQVTEKLVGSNSSVVTGAQAEALRRQAEIHAPQALASVRDTLRGEIAQSIKQSVSQSGVRIPFFILALVVPRAIGPISEQGDTATVAFNAGSSPVQLTMQRNGDRWKIVGIRNEELAASIASRVMQSLPAQIRRR